MTAADGIYDGAADYADNADKNGPRITRTNADKNGPRITRTNADKRGQE